MLSEVKICVYLCVVFDVWKSVVLGRCGEGIYSARNLIGATYSARAGSGADEGEVSVVRVMD